MIIKRRIETQEAKALRSKRQHFAAPGGSHDRLVSLLAKVLPMGVGVIAGFLAIQAFYAGAARVGAAQASLISTVEPLWTIVWAFLLFDERLQPLQWVGGAMILVGVILAQTRGRTGTAPRDEAPPLPLPVVHLSEE